MWQTWLYMYIVCMCITSYVYIVTDQVTSHVHSPTNKKCNSQSGWLCHLSHRCQASFQTEVW